jgi:hypothetical protein
MVIVRGCDFLVLRHGVILGAQHEELALRGCDFFDFSRFFHA